MSRPVDHLGPDDADRVPARSARPQNSPRPETLLRMFVGVYPPLAAAHELLGVLAGLALAAHRRTVPEQVHLTAHFIGPVDPRRLADAVESFERSCAGLPAFELVPSRVISLPHGGRPRLIAIQTDAPASLVELRRRLVTRFARPSRRPVRGEEGEAERFLPHVTLCRFREGEHQERVDAPVRAPAFRVERVHLMRSVLRPSGAVHNAVAVSELAAF